MAEGAVTFAPGFKTFPPPVNCNAMSRTIVFQIIPHACRNVAYKYTKILRLDLLEMEK